MTKILDPIRLVSAKSLRDTLRSAENTDVFYAAITFVDSDDLARVVSGDSDITPNTVITDSDEYLIRQNITTMHKVLNGGVSRVTRRIDWAPNGLYFPYLYNQNSGDDFYVVSTEIIAGVARTNVYKCLYAPSNPPPPASVPPTGIQTPPFATPDGYWWKYMYSINNSDATLFMTSDYLPVPERVPAAEGPNLTVGTTRYDQFINQQNVLQGTIFYLALNAAAAPNGGITDRSINLTLVNGIPRNVSQQYFGTLTWSASKQQWDTTLYQGKYGIGYSFGTYVVTTDSDSLIGPAGTSVGWLLPQVSKGLGHGANPADELNGTTVMIVSRNTPEDLTSQYFANNFYTCNLMRNPIDTATSLYGQQQFYNVSKSFDIAGTSNPFQNDDLLINQYNPDVKGRVVFTSGQRIYYTSVSPEYRPFDDSEFVVSPDRPGVVVQITKTYPSNIEFGSGDLVILNKLPQPLTRSADQTESLSFIVQY